MSVPGNLYTPTIRKTRGGDYLIEQSLLFDGSTTYLNRTPGTAGNRKTWTYSVWFKHVVDGSTANLFFGGVDLNNCTRIQFQNTGSINLRHLDAGVVTYQVATNGLYRDPSAWYHIVVSVDTTQATAADRVKIYINGIEQSYATTDYPAQNFDVDINSTAIHYIGRTFSTQEWDGLMALPILVDGTALDPNSFGEEDADGYWNPIEYTGSFGTNGFVLDFSDTSNFGDDTSGNGNDYTPNNFTASDQLSDTPTDSSADGHGNFCTWNPLTLDITVSSGTKSSTLSNGNLTYTGAGGGRGIVWGTIGVEKTGHWKIEYVLGDTDNRNLIGWTNNTDFDPSTDDISVNGDNLYTVNVVGAESIKINSTVIDTSATHANNGDTVGLSVDFDATTGNVKMFVNNTEVASGDIDFSSYGDGPWFPFTCDLSNTLSQVQTTNFGQSAFTTTNFPAAAKALATHNLPAPTIADGSQQFTPVIYTGTGSELAITSLDFTPDFVWIKNRDATDNHMLYDSVRGATKDLHSNTTDAETTTAQTLKSFDSTGFTLGTDVQVNTNTEDYVAWCWKAGGTAVSNTDGSITSSVSANPTAGFSIVTYTGIRPTTGTVGHGLTQRPDMIIFKNRADATTWYVWHKDLTNQTTYVLFLDTTAAQTNVGTSTFNNTAPTSTVFSLGNDSNVNDTSDSHVAYCWHSVEGFSKFGSYTGNGSTDGPFVYCGFKPAFLMIKRTDSTGSWHIYDKERLGYNPNNNILYADTTNAEISIAQDDLLSNGFKMRNTGAARNASGGTYIYMAFAEKPFQGDDGYTQARAR